MVRALGVLLVATIASACGDAGGVHIAIGLPSDALSPMTQNLARLELVTEAPGRPSESVTRDVASMHGTIGFGDVAIGGGVELSLLGFSASGRLVGYGRASASVELKDGKSVDVSIPLRRPFAYVSGGSSLLACDTTVEPGDTFDSRIDAAATPLAVATTADGEDVLTISGTALTILSTATHGSAGAPVTTLHAGATEIAVSPDSRWAVVVHPDGISIVDLDQARHSAVTPSFVAIAGAGGVAVARDTAWVLVNPSVAGPDACSAESALLPVALATGDTGASASLAGAARDLAVSSDGRTIYVAEPCQNAIVAVTGAGSSQVTLASVPSPTQVAVAGSRVWALGVEAAPEHLVLVSVNEDRSAMSRLDVAAIQELAKSNDLTEDGQTAEVRLDADGIEAYSMSVLPDGRNVVLLVHGTYHADQIVRTIQFGDITFDEEIVPDLDMETYEYQLVDVTTGSATQRLRTSCTIDWTRKEALLDDWDCASAQGQVTSDENFIARQATVLYGAH